MATLSFLSEDWLANLADGAAGLPEQPGVDGVVRFVVTSTPHGKVQFRLVVSDGRVAEMLVGRDGEAEATVTWKYADAVAQFRGVLNPDVAYMTGRARWRTPTPATCSTSGRCSAALHGPTCWLTWRLVPSSEPEA